MKFQFIIIDEVGPLYWTQNFYGISELLKILPLNRIMFLKCTSQIIPSDTTSNTLIKFIFTQIDASVPIS